MTFWNHDQQPVAPSAEPENEFLQMPRELSTEEIHSIVQKFAKSASYAVQGGADGVELHAAHGYLINEFCVEHKKPWVYGGAVATEGMTAAFLPGGPCFSCFTGATRKEKDVPDRSCRSFGVLNTLTAIVSSLEVMEAVKILTGADTVRRELLFLEIWDNELELLSLEKNPECPICGKHEYRYLKKTV